MNDGAAIEVRGVTKRYRGGVLANDEISLSIPKGMVFGVLGPNGAGKTTLVRQITGELVPTAGAIRVNDIDILERPLAAKSLMGVVPQEASPYQHLKPHEHLVFFGRLHGMSRSQARGRADELMAALGLEEHAGATAVRLSGGLKRKLLVGSALMAEPSLLVLDEPTTGLDPHSRREVWALLESLRGRGTTILITTHYMDEAEALCDRVAVMGAGRILAMGTVEELRGLCQRRYKATFENGAGQRQTVFGAAYDDVVDELARLDIHEYTIGKTTLEDLYLELTSQTLEETQYA